MVSKISAKPDYLEKILIPAVWSDGWFTALKLLHIMFLTSRPQLPSHNLLTLVDSLIRGPGSTCESCNLAMSASFWLLPFLK